MRSKVRKATTRTATPGQKSRTNPFNDRQTLYAAPMRHTRRLVDRLRGRDAATLDSFLSHVQRKSEIFVREAMGCYRICEDAARCACDVDCKGLRSALLVFCP